MWSQSGVSAHVDYLRCFRCFSVCFQGVWSVLTCSRRAGTNASVWTSWSKKDWTPSTFSAMKPHWYVSKVLLNKKKKRGNIARKWMTVYLYCFHLFFKICFLIREETTMRSSKTLVPSASPSALLKTRCGSAERCSSALHQMRRDVSRTRTPDCLSAALLRPLLVTVGTAGRQIQTKPNHCWPSD